MTLFTRRTIAAVAVASVMSFPLIASPAVAGTGHEHKAAHSQAAHKHSKHVKKFHAKFVVVGKVKAVSADSITVTVKGGNLKKAVRGTDVVVAVNADTKITADDVQKTLADVAVGDRVAVKGTRAKVDGVVTYTAKRVQVKDADTDSSTSTTTPAPATTAPTS